MSRASYVNGVEKQMDIIQIDDVHPRFGKAEKVAGNNVVCWSLPAGREFACPGATDECERDCYAQMHHHLRPNVQRAFARNFLWLKEQEKLGNARATAKQIAPDIITWCFRIHESGDFHSQFAVDVWEHVARLRPEVKFWFYTRSFGLDFSRFVALPNVQGWASADLDNRDAARLFKRKYREHGVKIAWGPWSKEAQRRMYLARGQVIPKDAFVCPVYTDQLPMSGACVRCKLCIIKNRVPKDVVFPRHVGRCADRYEP